MNQTMKVAMMALVLLYIVSPVDMAPGPIDDMIVALLGFAGTRFLNGSSKLDNSEKKDY